VIAVAKKIKELTTLFVESGNLDDEMKAANLALKNQAYSQAWEHFYNLYSLTDSKIPSFNYYRGHGAYGLCKVMQECPNEDELVTHLMQTDPELVRKGKLRTITPKFAREYIGRKYLVFAADTCALFPAIVEYALNCVGCGHAKSFVYKYNDIDAQIGLQWAKQLIEVSKDPTHQSIGHIVYAKYHFARYTQYKYPEEIRLFCERVLTALNLVGEKYLDRHEYVMYFYAHVCANGNFKDFEQGKYYDTKKGYQLFCKVVETAKDPDLVVSANNIKTMLETKYPSKIR
jgi:hypothetical protein